MTTGEPRQHLFESQRLRLAYWGWGDPARPPCICLHGGVDQARSWDRMAAALSDDYYVVAPDLRGHGDSQWAIGGEYSTSQNVVDLMALIDRLDGPVRVLAHSFGGHVTFMAAGAFPERFHSIVAIEGRLAGWTQRRPFSPERLRETVTARRNLETRTPRVYPSIEAARQRLSQQNPRLSPSLARHIAGHAVRPVETGAGEAGYVWKFDNWARPGVRNEEVSLDEAKAFFARIDRPVLYIVGGDSGAKQDMQSAAEHFPNARALVVPGAGHWVHHDEPDLVIDAAREFFGGAGGPEPPLHQ
jgi:pimeloyl-ACP methyl ester carboxylesterase